ncbi:MAG TPA: hypothetical protein VMD75_00375 [Candidatus Binataceae bacterium]|nr:hypothetical protein [Candidatus Binataceae bacterium]
MARNIRGKVVPLREEDHVAEDLRQAHELSEALISGGPRPFPVVSTLPRLPAMIPDEILDYYGWVFCQGGFSNLQMTFEQFLTVVAAVSPSGLCPEYDGADNLAARD